MTKVGIKKRTGKQRRIIIVGAGPVGCYTAQMLRRSGLNPLLIEEHKEVGKPVHCAGLVGRKVLKESLFPIPGDVILNTINGARIHCGKKIVDICREKVAYVIDRERFDKALSCELDIRYETKFLGLERSGGKRAYGYIVETDKGEIPADIVIGADGALSPVRSTAGLNGKVTYSRGVQFRIEMKPWVADKVEVFIRQPYFFWIIPESARVVRVGAISDNPYQDLTRFIEEEGVRGTVIGKYAGVVPEGQCRTQLGNIFLVGDSACQVKPLTYGGIYFGMRCAEILADLIATGHQAEYPKKWKRRFGKEIKWGQLMRHVFGNLSRKDVDFFIDLICRKKEMIERIGDFENHSLLILAFLKEPKLLTKWQDAGLRLMRAVLPR